MTDMAAIGWRSNDLSATMYIFILYYTLYNGLSIVPSKSWPKWTDVLRSLQLVTFYTNQ